MSYNPQNPNGSTSNTGSAPVVLSNDYYSTTLAKVTDGTNTANVLKSDGTRAGTNAVLVAPTYQEQASLSAGSLNADLVPSTDVSGYTSFSIQVTGTWSGTLQFQGSNDNSNFVTTYVTNTGNTQPVTQATSNNIFSGPIMFRYLRIRMTSYTSGTANGTLELKTLPLTPTNIYTLSGQSGTWTVGSNSATGSAVPSNAFYVGLTGSSGNLSGWASGNQVGDASGSSSSGSIAPLIYNGTSWDRIRAANTASGTTGTGLLGAGHMVYDGTNWQKSTSLSSGSGVQLVDINDGTNSANVLAGDSGFNSQLVGYGAKTYTFSTSTSGAQTILANTPCEGYSYIEVIYSSVGSGLALTGQFATASGGTYVNQNSFAAATGNQFGSALGTAASTLYVSPIRGNYFQIAVSALTSGTFAGTVTLRSGPLPTTAISASVSGASGTGSAVPTGAFYNAVNGRTSAPTNVSNGQLVGALGLVNGAVVTAPALLNVAVAVSSSATVVKSSAGFLSGVLVTAAGSSQAMTIYDNASTGSGTVIGIIPSGATAGTYYPFNMPAANGITCSGSSSNPAVTVAYS